MPDVLLIQGTALALPLKDASVHCCVTSPPYYGLRSYGIGEGELGLEPTLEAYVEAMVQVFREVWRVLRPDGTLWLNLGDVYSSGNRGSFGPLTGKNVAVKVAPRMAQPPSLPEKSLLGLPWRVALALQADGWTLRAEIIWHKVNPMPESVQDRPTRAHEQVFMLSKSPRYFYDAIAVQEPAEGDGRKSGRNITGKTAAADSSTVRHNASWNASMHYDVQPGEHRACRSVWSLTSEGFAGSHFATFPTALVRRCLLAGAPSQVCAACGAPWVRTTERSGLQGEAVIQETERPAAAVRGVSPSSMLRTNGRTFRTTATTGFAPTCACQHASMPATVLDPFCGSGTTLVVARELGHHAVGIDLSAEYLRNIARVRLGLTALQAWQEGAAPRQDRFDDLPLFAT